MEKAQAFGDKLARKLFGATVSLSKARDLVQNNYDLGIQHLNRGNLNDAVMRFKLVVWLDPSHAGAWYNLGRAYLGEDKRSLAVPALKKAQKLKPGDEETAYMLAIAMDDTAQAADLPKRIPPAMALSYFESQAQDYSAEQLARQYQGHTLLVAAVRARLVEGRVDHNVLDLGVGTGLLGPGLRDISASITGVDFSQKMLDQAMQVKDAQGKKTYDALIRRDAHEFLAEASGDAYDVVVAATVFSYLGDLRDIFQHIARVLKKGGTFAFTADMMDGPEFRFDTREGRFHYSKGYLQSLAAANGLKEVSIEPAEVYPDQKMWLCVFTK